VNEKYELICLEKLVFVDGEPDKRLVESIKRYGQLKPVDVKPVNRKYLVIDGNRRCRAIKRAKEEGLHDGKVKCIVVKENDEYDYLRQLLSNLVRSPNPMLEAKAMKVLMDRYGYTAKDMQKILGLSPSQVSQRLGLLKLPENLQRAVEEGTLKFRIARMIVSLSKEKQEKIAEVFEKEGKLSEKDVTMVKREEFEEDLSVEKIEIPESLKKKEERVFVKCIGCGGTASVILNDGKVVGVICYNCLEEEGK